MHISKTIVIAKLIMKYYDNWWQIFLFAVLGRKSKKIVLKGGTTITSQNPSLPISALARLLEDGWTFSLLDDRFMLLQYDSKFSIKCRYDIGFDLGHLVEIFVDKAYGSESLNEVILDVGMSNGDSSIYFALKGAKKVISLEPFEESYELAVENIKRNRLEQKIIPIKSALSSESSTRELIISKYNPNANSMSVSDHISNSGITFESRIPTRTITIDEIIRSFNLDSIDLLKLDCEGCEYEVIGSLSAQTFAAIKEIRLEFHNYAKDLLIILSKYGFRVEWHGKRVGYIRATKRQESV